MLNLRENRNKLIQKAIDSITETDAFEYEPSEIITALFESFDSDSTDATDCFKDRKLDKVKDITFFPNSSTYIKKRADNENWQ